MSKWSKWSKWSTWSKWSKHEQCVMGCNVVVIACLMPTHHKHLHSTPFHPIPLHSTPIKPNSHFHHFLIDNFGVTKAVMFMFIINLLVFTILYFNYYLSILCSFFIIFLGEFFFKKIIK